MQHVFATRKTQFTKKKNQKGHLNQLEENDKLRGTGQMVQEDLAG